MDFRRRHGFALLLGVWAFGADGLARAQERDQPSTDKPGAAAPDPGTPAEPSGPALEPPTLVEVVEADYPAEALAARQEGRVVLRLSIDVEGHVTEAEVVEGAGHGFEEAARAAVMRFRFSPAKRDGAPVRARILHAYEFHLPALPAEGSVAERVAPPDPEGRVTAGETAAPTPALPVAADRKPVDVSVRGYSEAERLSRSAEAVQVLETEQAKRQSQDLGEVLARTQGVAVQRSSGLGSDTRISLNGLTDDQIRFFLDGIPLQFMGYPFGLANVPVNLVERIEVYRGVVPVRFGADALGGAINLVSGQNPKAGWHGAASFQAGSFGVYRATANGHYLDKSRGWFTRVGAFLDLAKNDYPMNVVVPDASGQEVLTRVNRFHDAYRARGANLEAGVVNKPWAKRLSLRAFVTDHDKEIPHNLFMTFNPYGDVQYGQTSYGAVARYDNVFLDQLTVRGVAGYGYEHTSYSDLGQCVYDWRGNCIRSRPQPGERIGRAQDQEYFEHNLYGRVNLEWSLRPQHTLHLSVSPTYTSQTGIEHRLANPAARDPLSAERKLGGVVTGIAYEVELLDGKLSNQSFFKDYLQLLRSEDPLSNGLDFRRQDRITHRAGVGDSVRYFFLEWLYAKASYEWATRLPRADEIFGNAFPVAPNLSLRPEASHNFNLGLKLDALSTPIGELRAELNGFLREVGDLIRIVGDDESASYRNVRDARSLGFDSALGWTSLGKYVALDGNATYVDFRNTSKSGSDAAYEGDRIPNRPYFFATGNARFRVSDVAALRDELSLMWTSRYVHSFLRGWESIGTDKPLVPEQLLHSVALTYLVRRNVLDLSFSGEAHNLSDAEAFDYFGVPKPGRAFYFKTTVSH
ncbi:MAG: TonB-dependent siderophore myxochelin receptor MxcH [Polyangiaceae bacterium]